MDGAYTTHATDVTLPDRPPIVARHCSYGNASNHTFAEGNRPGAKRSNRHWEYIYDKLDHLTLAEKGVQGGTFTALKPESWSIHKVRGFGMIRPL